MPDEPAARTARWCVLGRSADGAWSSVDITGQGPPTAETPIPHGDLPGFIAARERAGSWRWVWHDTAAIAPSLLAQGIRVERCHDLRLCHQILRNSSLVTDRTALAAATEWAAPPPAPEAPRADTGPTLFDLAATRRRGGTPESTSAAVEEFARQRAALAAAPSRPRLALLLAAESAGALIAAELTSAGVPWDAETHDEILSEALGPRPASGARPARMQAIGDEVRRRLGDPTVSLDSAPKLLAALRAAGIPVASTSQWELREHAHPAIPPLLEYKRLARLLSANGWAWIDEWVRDGRYRPIYVPGGVVTGRWASSGGGALQIPRLLRPALRADPGWTLVSADVAQLEPRILAAMSGDRAMLAASTGKDLYAGIVESGAVATRQEAKMAMLGAMYGATTGDSGRLVPRLRRAFPDAMRLVDEAAATGERGGIVTTWLGRSSPAPSNDWHSLQAAASLHDASPGMRESARRAAREQGRFTRNFVVQGSAAEWALAWMAGLRLQLSAFEPVAPEHSAGASGIAFARTPHLAFFLHDEIIVHTPREHADEVAAAVASAADAAGKAVFGRTPVEFRLDLTIAERAEKG